MLNKKEKKATEDSDIETEKKTSVNTSKISTCINPKKYLYNDYRPKLVFTNEDKNLSYYESDSNNSYGEKKFQSLNKILRNRNNNFIFRKNTQPQQNYIKENFSCNFLNNEENNENNENKKSKDCINQRMILNYLMQSCDKVPKRTIKQQQSEYDVEKSDNFNVISNKNKKFEFKNHKKGGKIIQILQKEEADGFFYPSKRSKPCFSPSPINNNQEKDKALSSKKPVLNAKRFFRSHISKKNVEEKKEKNKSLSKRKMNQLEDYNIEKLIEIGDNNSNKYKNILSFGRKINSIKSKNNNSNNNNNNGNNRTFDTIENKQNIKKKLNEVGSKKGDLNPKKKIKRKSNHNNTLKAKKDQKLIIKKIINHVKGFPKLKTTQTYGNLHDDISNNNLDDNFHESERIKSHKSQDITEYNNNIILDINDCSGKSNTKGRNYYRKKKEYTLSGNITTPRISFPKKEEDTKPNINKNRFVYKNLKNLNHYIKNQRFSNTTSKENTSRNDLTKTISYTEEQNTLRKSNQNITQTINPIDQKHNSGNNYREKLLKYRQAIKKNNGKMKTYYGYDERHTLEGSINNHTTYVSVYSRKIINHNNNSIDRQNIKEK
jgi:hypothetical protein